MASRTATGKAGGKAVRLALKTWPHGKRHSRAWQAAEGGFTYLWLLFVLAISAAGTAAVGELWVVQVQRSKELDLSFRGRAIVAALESYRAASAASTPCAPEGWEQLLQDKRTTQTVRHLRRPYADPLAPNGEWELIKDSQGRMLGVKSRPLDAPMVTAPAAAGKTTVAAYASGARVFQIGAAMTKLVCLNAPPVAAVGSVDTRDSMREFQNK
jgi:type II secretory pathway pseudopilin PulG